MKLLDLRIVELPPRICRAADGESANFSSKFSEDEAQNSGVRYAASAKGSRHGVVMLRVGCWLLGFIEGFCGNKVTKRQRGWGKR